MTAAVTTFVFTPVIAWTFTQSRPDFSTPYFSSYHRTNLLVEKPVESGANVVSTIRSGRLLWTISDSNTGVSKSLSRKAQVVTL